MKVDHIGIAVESIEAALPFYREQLGLTVAHREDVPGQKVRVAFLTDGHGGCLLELMEPLGGEGAVSRFLQNRGPGMHHVAFHVEGIEHTMERLTKAGKAPLEDKPRPGARGHKVCFIHPKHAGGVLVELVEEKGKD